MTRLLPRALTGLFTCHFAPVLTLLCLLALPAPLSAGEAPAPFQARYSAAFMGMRASAERSLAALGDDRFELRSRVRLRLLGKTVTEISELSSFRWQDGRVWSQDYHFVQSGLGKRQRSVAFDWEARSADVEVNGRPATLPLEGEVFDELNALIGLRQQLAEGAQEVSLQAIEKDELDEERYRVLARETLDTALGEVEALQLEKVRGPGSERVTRIWLAPDWDYLLVKLYQRDPDGRELTLDVAEASLGGQALSAREP